MIHKIQISRIITETSDSKTFVLQSLDGWEPQYQAGQFLTLIFYTRNGEKRRSYSISSTPSLNEELSITVKKIDNGEFSRLLVYHAKEGDVLYTSGISGFFQLPADSQLINQYVFLAAGSGITPCLPLIKTILLATSAQVLLIFSNKAQESAIFLKQFEQLRDDHKGRLVIHFLFSNSLNIFEKRLSKWLLVQLLENYIPGNVPHARYYLCGPWDYMMTIRITLLGLGVPSQQIIKENFNTLPPLIIKRPPDTNPYPVTIHFNGKQYNLIVQYPKTILAAAKAEKIELPYSCEAGRCGSCSATCIKGIVWMSNNEVLMDDELEAGRILTCQSFPIGGEVELRIE